jgi:MobA/MobL family protein
MASYFLHVKTISRKTGARVTRAAAYRAGERIHDERSSDVFDFCDRQDVVHKEIVLAAEMAGREDMGWARDRQKLWNAAEHAGKRRNSLLARDVLVFLPPELTPAQRTVLVRAFSQELADRYRNAVDFVIHAPRPGSDPRHHHAHLLMTSREVRPEGLGPRTTLELSGTERHARGLGPSKNDYLLIRERWAQVSNEALRDAGVAARIDHRSLQKQGIDREPVAAIPQKVYYAERKSGVRTRAGDEIRARQRERVEARLKGSDELARVLQRQKEENRRRAISSGNGKDALPRKTPRSALTREELNQKRRERHQANAQALNQKRRERYRENAEVERQKYRTWRQANAEEVNERRRQWRAANAEKVNARARDYRRAHAADDAARRWSKLRDNDKRAAEAAERSGGTEQGAVWLGEAQRPVSADEAARNWEAFRDRQKETDSTQAVSEGPAHESRRAHESGSGGSDDDDEDGTDGVRRRDYDLGL